MVNKKVPGRQWQWGYQLLFFIFKLNNFLYYSSTLSMSFGEN